MIDLDIKGLKDFERLLKACRREGVSGLTLPGLVLRFGDLPEKAPTPRIDPTDVVVDSDGPSDDELTFYSAPPGE